MSEPKADPPLDPYLDVLGLNLAPDRLSEVIEAYRGMLEEIRKLRELDLTDIHPAVIFEPTAAYRKEPGA